MSVSPSLAGVAALIGDATRAAMLVELMNGRALTATELAARAGVAPSTASDHLRRLVDGGLLAYVAQGRHRYFRLASEEVARVIEALDLLGSDQHGTVANVRELRTPADGVLDAGLWLARTCYDHLAGWVGVSLTEAFVQHGYLGASGDRYEVTEAGEAWFTASGVDLAAARRARRAFARACLDWTERRPHLAGALGRAVLARLFERGWISRVVGEREVTLTSLGVARLRSELGILLPQPPMSRAAVGRQRDSSGS